MDVFVTGPGDIVIFFDPNYPDDGQEPRFNRVGVVIDERGALTLQRSLFGSAVSWIPLQELTHLNNVSFRRLPHDDLRDEIAAFFLRYKKKPAIFEAGLRMLRNEILYPFRLGSIFPPAPTYSLPADYEAAWVALNDCLKPGDVVFTLDQSSLTSRFIALATHGPFSHVAIYVGSGEIHESVTTGLRRVRIETYKGQRYRVAAFRHIATRETPPTEDKIREAVRNTKFRDGYNYLGAIRFGLKSFRGDHDHGLVPNSTLYLGLYDFIGQA